MALWSSTAKHHTPCGGSMVIYNQTSHASRGIYGHLQPNICLSYDYVAFMHLCQAVSQNICTYLKACAQRFRYALFAFIHTQTYFEYYTLTLRLASLVKRAVIYAYWTKELFDICRENVSHMATLPSVARHVIHADNLGPHH